MARGRGRGRELPFDIEYAWRANGKKWEFINQTLYRQRTKDGWRYFVVSESIYGGSAPFAAWLCDENGECEKRDWLVDEAASEAECLQQITRFTEGSDYGSPYSEWTQHKILEGMADKIVQRGVWPENLDVRFMVPVVHRVRTRRYSF